MLSGDHICGVASSDVRKSIWLKGHYQTKKKINKMITFKKGSSEDLSLAYKLAAKAIDQLLDTMESFVEANTISKKELEVVKEHYSKLVMFSNKSELDFRKAMTKITTLKF